MVKRFTFFFVVSFCSLAFAGDYLFISSPYLQATKNVVGEADVQAPAIFGSSSPFTAKYEAIRDRLVEKIDSTQQKRLQKKITNDIVNDVNDKTFAEALNGFKDALNLMARKADRPLPQLLPSYTRWTQIETSVVKSGLDQRLSSYQTRFGPDSEPINVLELLVSEKYLPGDEAGPSEWEPIVRFSALQITNRASGITSGIEIGSNYYFLDGAPAALQMMGVTNHVGLAATLQYTEDPGVFNFRGRPSFGVMVHLDRKEAGLAWDPHDKKIRLSLGYAFQFVPFVF